MLGLYFAPEADGMLVAVPQQIFNAFNSFPFLTIPLFGAGLIPALINGAGLILCVILISRRRNYGGNTRRATLRELGVALVRAIPALFMIVIILGGILSGAFTPTEASAVAVIYGLLIAAFVYRDLKLSMMP